MKTKRIKGFTEIDVECICYYKNEHSGNWMVFHPDIGLGNLSDHDVTEHEDGTITVRPSILIEGMNSVHGYLEKGKWRDC